MPMPAIHRARFRVATVEVFARRNPENPELVKVTEARLTYVAIDHEGRPRPLPCQTPAA